jgi:hypothetical protein
MQHAWGEEECVQGYLWESQKERDHYEDLDVHVRWKDNIKINLKGMGSGGMDWINPEQVRDQWRALVNTVIKLWVP